jgi:hypothetical protein
MTFPSVAALLGTISLGAYAHEAGHEPSQHAPSRSAVVTQADTQQARRVVRDKETGQLRAPTAEERAAEAAERRARGEAEPTYKSAPLVVRQHANGMRSAVLGEDYMVKLVAERGPDGKVVIRHANPAHEHRISTPSSQGSKATE